MTALANCWKDAPDKRISRRADVRYCEPGIRETLILRLYGADEPVRTVLMLYSLGDDFEAIANSLDLDQEFVGFIAVKGAAQIASLPSLR